MTYLRNISTFYILVYDKSRIYYPAIGFANMSAQEQHKPGHYSGLNRIPNIKEFAASLDRDKKNRDAQIDKEQKTKRHQGVKEHKNDTPKKKGRGRKVTDPVTGNEVEIEDVDAEYMKQVDNPQVNDILYTHTYHVHSICYISTHAYVYVFHSSWCRMQIWGKKRQ